VIFEDRHPLRMAAPECVTALKVGLDIAHRLQRLAALPFIQVTGSWRPCQGTTIHDAKRRRSSARLSQVELTVRDKKSRRASPFIEVPNRVRKPRVRDDDRGARQPVLHSGNAWPTAVAYFDLLAALVGVALHTGMFTRGVQKVSFQVAARVHRCPSSRRPPRDRGTDPLAGIAALVSAQPFIKAWRRGRSPTRRICRGVAALLSAALIEAGPLATVVG
jgi:hypothetical protein